MLTTGINFAVRCALCILRKAKKERRKAQVGFTPLEVRPARRARRQPLASLEARRPEASATLSRRGPLTGPRGGLLLTGFTLVEVMVATSILSLGIVLIFESFFISMDSFNYCTNYLNVASRMDEKIWKAQDNLSRFGPSSQIETAGRFLNRNKSFEWNLSYNLIYQDLYQIDLTLFLQQGQRKVKLYRSTYVLYESPEGEAGINN